jgi:hypothetical protein
LRFDRGFLAGADAVPSPAVLGSPAARLFLLVTLAAESA